MLHPSHKDSQFFEGWPRTSAAGGPHLNRLHANRPKAEAVRWAPSRCRQCTIHGKEQHRFFFSPGLDRLFQARARNSPSASLQHREEVRHVITAAHGLRTARNGVHACSPRAVSIVRNRPWKPCAAPWRPWWHTGIPYTLGSAERDGPRRVVWRTTCQSRTAKKTRETAKTSCGAQPTRMWTRRITSLTQPTTVMVRRSSSSLPT